MRLAAHRAAPRSAARRWTRFHLGLTVGILLAGAAAAQTSAQQPPAKPCASKEYRQLDFWVGTWEVRNRLHPDRPPSTSHISSEEGGCVIVERYSTPSGYTGRSLSFYDAARKLWHQTWIDSQGEPLYLDGRFEDGAMVLSSEGPDGAIQRVTWKPLDGGKVGQVWDTSADGGKTWKTVFDGVYSPKG